MILDIIENIPMLIIPAYLVYIILRLFFEYERKSARENIISLFKFMFCLAITLAVLYATYIVIVMQIYQIALVWQEYEATNYLNPLIKSMSYASIEFVWSLIAVVLSWQIFKSIYFNQIISGSGTVKQRISCKWQELKTQFKKRRVKE